MATLDDTASLLQLFGEPSRVRLLSLLAANELTVNELTHVTELGLAPRARSVTCVDQSDTLIEAARLRLARFANVRCEAGDLQALRFDDESFDQVLVFNVLTHLKWPARGLAEAARVLRPGGTLALV